MRDEIETTIKTRRTTMNPENEIDKTEAVSYTHLTLPTICSV
mgnify:CR=1 FL=1